MIVVCCHGHLGTQQVVIIYIFIFDPPPHWQGQSHSICISVTCSSFRFYLMHTNQLSTVHTCKHIFQEQGITERPIQLKQLTDIMTYRAVMVAMHYVEFNII